MKEHALLPFWHLGILNVAPGSCNHVPFLISSRLPSGNHSPRSLPVPKPHVPDHTCCLCFRVPEWRTHFLPPPSTALMLLFPASQSTALPPPACSLRQPTPGKLKLLCSAQLSFMTWDVFATHLGAVAEYVTEQTKGRRMRSTVMERHSGRSLRPLVTLCP